MAMRARSGLNALLVTLFTTLTAGCGGSSNPDLSSLSASTPASAPPAGLRERDSTVVYAVGHRIVPDTLSSSGGAITQCSVSPALPAGLTMDPQTGTISGTPTAVSHDTVYTVTCSNAAGSASTRLEIEVKDHVIAPDSLSYLNTSVVYVANLQITPNTPIAAGGEITQFSVSPALPAGLALDPQTGVITGTPTDVTASAVYTVTGSNSADSVETQLTIEVTAQFVPPTSLAYSDPVPVYIVGLPIVENEPQSTGGEITQFSVSPALPAGLSINAQTGEIGGTPTTAVALTVYTVTGTNGAGSVTAQLTIDVDNAVIGEWLPADALDQGRFRHTATLLPDGRVLVAAGQSRGVLSSAELYDPASGSWSTTGVLAQARYYHTATLLPGGTVLVAGGSASAYTSLSSVELYDPATGTWSGTGSMSRARDTHTATLLANGKVLVAGGESNNTGALASAELYDPATGTWSPTGGLAQARYFHTATLLNDGRVLVAGGYDGSVRLSSAEIYDPATGTWSPTGSLAQGRSLHTAALLPDGRVLVAGGFFGRAALASAEVFNPATGAWSATGNLNQARYFHAATLLPGGKVLVAGGSGASSYLLSAELYDPSAGTWSLTGSLHQARSQQAASLLPDGRVLAAGGYGLGYLTSSELFH